jgi:hypothetical protein
MSKKVMVNVPVVVNSDLEAPQAQVALISIAGHFTTKELVAVSKKLKNPLVLAKIKSMI